MDEVDGVISAADEAIANARRAMKALNPREKPSKVQHGFTFSKQTRRTKTLNPHPAPEEAPLERVASLKGFSFTASSRFVFLKSQQRSSIVSMKLPPAQLRPTFGRKISRKSPSHHPGDSRDLYLPPPQRITGGAICLEARGKGLAESQLQMDFVDPKHTFVEKKVIAPILKPVTGLKQHIRDHLLARSMSQELKRRQFEVEEGKLRARSFSQGPSKPAKQPGVESSSLQRIIDRAKPGPGAYTPSTLFHLPCKVVYKDPHLRRHRRSDVSKCRSSSSSPRQQSKDLVGWRQGKRHSSLPLDMRPQLNLQFSLVENRTPFAVITSTKTTRRNQEQSVEQLSGISCIFSQSNKTRAGFDFSKTSGKRFDESRSTAASDYDPRLPGLRPLLGFISPKGDAVKPADVPDAFLDPPRDCLFLFDAESSTPNVNLYFGRKNETAEEFSLRHKAYLLLQLTKEGTSWRMQSPSNSDHLQATLSNNTEAAVLLHLLPGRKGPSASSVSLHRRSCT